ncbi:MAG TPA: hypothetical protein VGN26_12685 [Armatimonadota bacterium]|jgi:hypothetical protein
MKVRSWIASVLFVLLALPAGARAESPSKADGPAFCQPYTWLFGGWVAPPRMPLVGDLNGDGFADFLYASPKERFIDVSLNGRGWKPLRGERLLSDLPQAVAGMCLGRFGGKGLDLAVLGEKGQVVCALNDGSGKLSVPRSVAEVTGFAAPGWILPIRANPTQPADDVAVVTGDGRMRLLGALSGGQTAELHVAGPVVAAASGVDGERGSLLAVSSGRTVRVYQVGGSLKKVATLRAPKGQTALALGDVDGDGRLDVLANGTVFLGPDFRRKVAVPGWRGLTRPVLASLADVVGRGRADLVVQHEGRDYFGSTETDCDLYVSSLPTDADRDADGLPDAEEARLRTDPLCRDTDHDGLPDGWEVHGFAGIDFPGLGASPLHKDIFVMNLPYDHVPVAEMEKFMRERAVPFFAKLPYTNLDGTQGFAVHWMTQTPVLSAKASEGKGWPQLAAETFPRDRVGFYHWMLIGGMSGGGQSDELADSGSTGMGSWCHEFGHQLGLSHSGKWAAWSPTYTSLMNYSYSYRFEGDPEKVHFSTGELASLVLNESRLPGKVPFPIEKLKFLSGPPYGFRLKAAGPKATYVDWGWSGLFSSRPARANITFGYSVSGGERLQPSGTQTFNYNGPYELMTDFQASLAEHQGKLYMVTASRPPVEPTAPRPESATLVMQTYLGKRAWSAPTVIAPKVTGDPYAASDGKSLYVFYPTAEGVMMRAGSPDKLGEPRLIPDTKGALPSAVNWKGRLYVFLYLGPEKPIVCRSLEGYQLGPVMDLGIKSTVPPGPAVDTLHDQLLLGTAAPLGNLQHRWQLRRLAWNATEGRFAEVSCQFVGGEKSGWAGNRRPTLIFDPDRELGKDGRVYWIAAGLADPLTKPTSFYLAQTIGYKDINDGWLLWRYYDEWTNTRSGIGAAWFDKDIVLATTWASGTAGGDCGVFVAYNGTAISNVDMGDFDDISHMANYGIARSISTFARMPEADGRWARVGQGR